MKIYNYIFDERFSFLTHCDSGVSSVTGINKLLWWPVSREVISRWSKNTLSNLAWSVQVSHLPESIILGFPLKLVLSLDCNFVFAGIFCSYFLNEVLNVNDGGSAKLIFQGENHVFLDFSSLNLFHVLLYTCQPSRVVAQVHSHAVWKPISQILVEPVAALLKADQCQKSPSLSVGCCRILVSALVGFFPSCFVFAVHQLRFLSHSTLPLWESLFLPCLFTFVMP